MKLSELNIGLMVAGLLFAIGLTQAAASIGGSMIEMRRADRTVVVKGSAEQEVAADSATWRIPFRGVGETRQEAIDQANVALAAVQAFAAAGGLDKAEIITEPFQLRILRRTLRKGAEQVETVRYETLGAVRLRTDKVDEIAALSTKTNSLLDGGVLLGHDDFGNTPKPIYRFTGLNEIKPSLIAAATKAARASAQQFAQDSGSKIGGIASASQGVIQILARDSGFPQQYERDKRVRVVSTVRYYLE